MQTILMLTDFLESANHDAKADLDYPPMPLFVIPPDMIDTDGGSAGGSV
ncbi:hypothetical protein HK413_03095 [Mucilaginibacter sp. S1162]|uniref:Uncharacterized protein n=1 Tax=Mucilaginibacter humi TaxID=2732510 RepID=A0ABX1W1D4_9SPHI|nr:hypothetical protein [Mucilaginibacter humi]NNU33393.1 hypothetical protein [Mucilaginibacter humi]